MLSNFSFLFPFSSTNPPQHHCIVHYSLRARRVRSVHTHFIRLRDNPTFQSRLKPNIKLVTANKNYHNGGGVELKQTWTLPSLIQRVQQLSTFNRDTTEKNSSWQCFCVPFLWDCGVKHTSAGTTYLFFISNNWLLSTDLSSSS